MNRSPFAPRCGSNATDPTGRVAAIASKAAEPIAIRIIAG
jgi:hypothetical protein